MSIENYIRSKTNYLLRPLIIEDKCFICECEEDLHLHHVKPFAVMIREAHEALEIKYDDYETYSKEDRDMVTIYMLGLQLDSEYLTLCPECHMEEHKKEGNELQSIRNEGMNHIKDKRMDYVRANRLRKMRKEQKRIKKELVPYLIENNGKIMLQLEDRQEFIEMVNARDPRNNRLMKSLEPINEKLTNEGLPFKVVSYATSRMIDGKKKGFGAVWELKKTKGDILNADKYLRNFASGLLKYGEEYKYQELCDIFNEEPLTGNSKPAQLGRWEREYGIKFVKKPRAYLKVVSDIDEDKSNI